MHNYSGQPAPVVKGDKLGTFHGPWNQLEINQMKSIPYALAVRSIMYAQVCTRPDLSFVTGLLRRFQYNLVLKHRWAPKKALCYLEETKHYMLTYKKTYNLEVTDNSDADFAGCVLSKIHIRLCLHARECCHIVEEMQTNYYNILYNIHRIHSML
jgi:hypothetical protein